VIRAVGLTLAGLAVAALLGAADGEAVHAQNPKLFGTVGPGESIVLRDAQGNRVTRLDPGTYDIEVEDLSDEHNFHLRGPGVNRQTAVEVQGKDSWTVTFTDGTYTYLCDPHSTTMRGSVTVGNPPAQQAPAKTSAVTPRTRLVLTSGPAEVITLKTSAGKAVKLMKVGTYKVTVRDRGRDHNAHVVAPGFNRRTKPLEYTGTQTWTIKLARTGSFRFLCDPHALTGMKGSARIVR
jgi:plastocyanin